MPPKPYLTETDSNPYKAESNKSRIKVLAVEFISYKKDSSPHPPNLWLTPILLESG